MGKQKSKLGGITIFEKIKSGNLKKYRVTYNYDNIQGCYVIKYSHKYLYKYKIRTTFSEVIPI